MRPPCHSKMTEWLGPSSEYINVAVGCRVQIMLEMGECKQKMDFGPGNKALCMQILLCYQPALGADKERTDSSPWGIFIFVLHQRLERSSSFATQLWGQMSVGGTCL